MLFRFEDSELLLLLILIPLIAYLKGNRGQLAAIQFSSNQLFHKLGRNVKSNVGKFLFNTRLLALTLLILALARPQFGSGISREKFNGIDIILAVDLSTSMWAHDFNIGNRYIDRLTVVKSVMEDFIKERNADRIGIVAFAGNAYTVSPLTLNHEWLLENNLRRLEIGLIEDGTAIGTAIGTSANRLVPNFLDNTNDEYRGKSSIVVLLTDGSNNAGEIPPVAAAEAAAALGVKIYTIGAGTEGMVTAPRLDGNGNPILSRNGKMRMMRTRSQIDTETLKKIAEISNGKFFRATDTKSLKNIYKEIDELEKTEVEVIQHTIYDDIFMFPIFAGLILISIEQLLANTKFRTLP